MEGLALIANVLADLADDVGEFLQVVFHEVDLGIVIILDAIEAVPVLVPDLVDMFVD